MASWLAREAARAFEELPRTSPLLGTSEFIEDHDEDPGLWVLGSSRPAQRDAGTLTLTVARASPAPTRRLKPFIVR